MFAYHLEAQVRQLLPGRLASGISDEAVDEYVGHMAEWSEVATAEDMVRFCYDYFLDTASLHPVAPANAELLWIEKHPADSSDGVDAQADRVWHEYYILFDNRLHDQNQRQYQRLAHVVRRHKAGLPDVSWRWYDE